MLMLRQVPPFLFFTGKGGVGKTSLACATAIHLTASGKRVYCWSAPIRLPMWRRYLNRLSVIR